jgi:hypothetical protein
VSGLWLHLRSSIAKWGVIPLTVLGIAVLFGGSGFWVGIWPETGAAAQASAFFLGVLAAGLAAWAAATAEVRGLQEQFAAAAIRPFTIESARFTATLLWLLAPYLVVAATAFVTTAAELFPPGVGAFFRYIALGVVMIVFATAWGWLVGRLLPPLVAAVCAVLSWFIAASLLGRFAGATPASGPPWLEVQLGPLVIRAVAVLLFAAAVCALGWRIDRRGPAKHKGVVVALVALLGTVTAHVSTTLVSYRSPTAEPLCVEGTIEYCLWPEHAKYVSMVEGLDHQVAHLPLQLALPKRVVDYALSGSTQWIDPRTSVELAGTFAPEFDISEGSRWALARGVAWAIDGTVFAECDPLAEPDPQDRRSQLYAWLEWRLAGGGTPDYGTNAPNALQAAWSIGRQVAARQSEPDQAKWAWTIIADTKKNHCHVP